jgi:hypothetical protein
MWETRRASAGEGVAERPRREKGAVAA